MKRLCVVVMVIGWLGIVEYGTGSTVRSSAIWLWSALGAISLFCCTWPYFRYIRPERRCIRDAYRAIADGDTELTIELARKYVALKYTLCKTVDGREYLAGAVANGWRRRTVADARSEMKNRVAKMALAGSGNAQTELAIEEGGTK